MPFLTEEEVRRLLGPQRPADSELDLRSVEPPRALRMLERTIQDGRYGRPESVIIRIDPATPSSGETLFLPVGRALLEARRRRFVTRCHPLPEADGSGFYVQFSGDRKRRYDASRTRRG